MNALLFCIIVLITFTVTQFAGTQIIGILFIKLPNKEYANIIGLILWTAILYLYYLAITCWFSNYFQVYQWCTIISLIICILNFRNLKRENQ